MSQLPTTQEDEAQTPSNEQCGATAVGDYVEFLNDLPDIPVNTPSEIEQLAQLYDESQTLPNKEQHAPFVIHHKAVAEKYMENQVAAEILLIKACGKQQVFLLLDNP